MKGEVDSLEARPVKELRQLHGGDPLEILLRRIFARFSISYSCRPSIHVELVGSGRGPWLSPARRVDRHSSSARRNGR